MRFPTPLVILALAAIGCATAPPPVSIEAPPLVPGADEAVIVDHALILVDASDSIDRRSLFPGEKGLLDSFVGAMPDGSYTAGGISFGGDRRLVFPQEVFDRSQLRDRAAEVRHLGAGTPLDEVIGEAQRALAGRSGRTALILFSDGRPTSPRGDLRDPERVLAAARGLVSTHEGRVCIHTIQIGDDADGGALLQELARLTDCGSFRPAASVQDAGTLHVLARQVFLGGLPPVAAAPADRDRDGIFDTHDRCPDTPRGAPVDSTGCWRIPPVHFATDSSTIEPGDQEKLDAAVRILLGNLGVRLEVSGHTDSRGSAAYNQTLSERRARAVRDYLVSAGVAASRLGLSAWGESKPARPNDSPENMGANRRAELSPVRP